MKKLSKFNIIKPLENGEYVVFNTFNTNLSIFKSKKDYKKYDEYLTDIDELKFLKKIRIDEENSSDYAHYTIFITTTCNARCDYCFEKGGNKLSLTKDTINKIIEFIKKKSKKYKQIHIEFFGGEPLLYFENIMFISKSLMNFCNKNKIKYTSNIVTNASLLSENVINKLKKINIINIQVTLDGTKREYERRKNYIEVHDAYELVLKNIEQALKENLNISVRINFDKENFDDIMELLNNISYLNKYNNFYCYVMPIYSIDNKSKNLILSKEINKYFEKIFFHMIDMGYIKNEKYFQLKKVSNYCSAVRKNSYVFYPNGDIFKCTHLTAKEDCVGNVNYFKDINYKNNKYSNAILKGKCEKCKFLPLCQGGCVSNKNENSCSTNCYVYKDSINAVLNSILKLNNINIKIKEK